MLNNCAKPAAVNDSATQSYNFLPEGSWGGTHVRLDVTAAAATLEFDCGLGSIEKKIEVNADGSFDAIGVDYAVTASVEDMITNLASATTTGVVE